jgi:hypothetical protein
VLWPRAVAVIRKLSRHFHRLNESLKTLRSFVAEEKGLGFSRLDPECGSINNSAILDNLIENTTNLFFFL